ncbi:protein FAM131C isoform X5 [Odocoileus virginianus]|uniref:Protein FAM131C isoform X5 n=1 Tax=Odocoileus virginianus TaxID=9874 RepID=A0ABM4HGX1_ODOVR
MGSCVSRDLLTSAHKDCPLPQGTAPLNPDLPSIMAPDHVTGKDRQMDFCWDPWQRCFQTTNGYLSDSRSCSSNYNVAALATSSLVGELRLPPPAPRTCPVPRSHWRWEGVVQSIKDHITKPTAMARGRVAHLIEWKGWSAQRAAWELPPEDDEHYCHLPDELCEARFAADLGSIYLQDSLLSVRSQDDSLLAFSSPDSWPSPDEPPSLARQLQPRLPGALGPEEGASPQGPPRSVDGGPPSEEEDEVFYN